MNVAATVDVSRLIRISTLLGALFAGTMVYLAFEPLAAALQQRIDDAQAQLRSDEVAFSEVPHLRLERSMLAARYARLFSANPQAVFLRDLAAMLRHHHVSLATATVRDDAEPTRNAAGRAALFTRTHVTLALRGSYRDLLVTLADLSLGSEIVAVDVPNLQRDGTTVTASVPVTILAPTDARDSMGGKPAGRLP